MSALFRELPAQFLEFQFAGQYHPPSTVQSDDFRWSVERAEHQHDSAKNIGWASTNAAILSSIDS